MAFTSQVIESSIFHQLMRYVYSLFSRTISQYFTWTRRTKPQITSSYGRGKNCKEVDNLSDGEPSESEKEIEVKEDKSNHGKGSNIKHNQNPENSNRGITFEDPKEIWLIRYAEGLRRQQHFIGDNCDSCDPVEYFCEPDKTLTYKHILPTNRLKTNKVSKYTMSLTDDLSTKTDCVLKLLDELNKTSLTLLEDVSKNKIQHDNSLTQCIQDETNCLLGVGSDIIEDENRDAGLCYCLNEHHCLMNVDSEEKTTFLLGKNVSIHNYEDDYAMEEGLLTLRELSSVETGSDDNWLYKSGQSQLISALA